VNLRVIPCHQWMAEYPQLPTSPRRELFWSFGSFLSRRLMVHEANNETSDVFLANQYRAMYGHTAGGFVALDPKVLNKSPREKSTVFIDEDIIVGAPIWHDWGKSIVFQWNADGSEFPNSTLAVTA